jgi:hypothetical protein
MQDTMRIGAAALGGYVLGRTKKAKTAITLALWLSGRGRPSDMAREQAVKALQSKKGQELLGQLRGPVLSAGRQAALGVFESQAGRLSDSLSRRTDQLTAPGGDKVKKSSSRSRRRSDDDEDELSARRRPSDRTPERSRRPSRSRDVAEPEDEYEDEPADEDEDEYEDEYDAEYEDEDEQGEDEDEDEAEDDEDEGYEDEADEGYEDEADDGYDDEDYEDERPSSRRRAS